MESTARIVVVLTLVIMLIGNLSANNGTVEIYGLGRMANQKRVLILND